MHGTPERIKGGRGPENRGFGVHPRFRPGTATGEDEGEDEGEGLHSGSQKGWRVSECP